MGDKKNLEYDYESSISFHGNLMMVCGILAGFAFTGTVVILTRTGDPSALLSQVVLGILFLVMNSFIGALWSLQYMNILTCVSSPKKIIGIDPARWKLFTTFMRVGGILLMISIAVMFLLYDLVLLFVFAISFTVLGNLWDYFYRWKDVQKALDNYFAY